MLMYNFFYFSVISLGNYVSDFARSTSVSRSLFNESPVKKTGKLIKRNVKILRILTLLLLKNIVQVSFQMPEDRLLLGPHACSFRAQLLLFFDHQYL